MKNKEAFEKWYKEHDSGDAFERSNCQFAWQACEEYYESRRCENCKNWDEYGTCDMTANCTESDFACIKYWEPKE